MFWCQQCWSGWTRGLVLLGSVWTILAAEGVTVPAQTSGPEKVLMSRTAAACLLGKPEQWGENDVVLCLLTHILSSDPSRLCVRICFHITQNDLRHWILFILPHFHRMLDSASGRQDWCHNEKNSHDIIVLASGGSGPLPSLHISRAHSWPVTAASECSSTRLQILKIPNNLRFRWWFRTGTRTSYSTP